MKRVHRHPSRRPSPPHPARCGLARTALALICLLELVACRGAGTLDTPSGAEAVPARAATDPAPAGRSSLARVLEAGELRVGTSGDQPPLSMQSQSGESVGLEVDVVRALADALQLRVRTVTAPVAELLGMLERGDLDLVAAGLEMTVPPDNAITFVGPYFVSGVSLLGRSRELVETRDLRRLDASERTYAVMQGSSGATFVRQRLPRAKRVEVEASDLGVGLVLAGRADALAAEMQVCKLAQWRHPDAGLWTSPRAWTAQPLGFAIAAEASALARRISELLDEMEASGQLEQLRAKWLRDGSWIETLP